MSHFSCHKNEKESSHYRLTYRSNDFLLAGSQEYPFLILVHKKLLLQDISSISMHLGPIRLVLHIDTTDITGIDICPPIHVSIL